MGGAQPPGGPVGGAQLPGGPGGGAQSPGGPGGGAQLPGGPGGGAHLPGGPGDGAQLPGPVGGAQLPGPVGGAQLPGPGDGAGRRPVVVHVLEALRGGTARHVRDAVTWAPRAEHHVVLPPPRRQAEASGSVADADAAEAMAATGARLHRVDMRRSPAHPANAAAVLAVRRLLAATGADVVHGHSSIGGAVARLASPGTGAATVYTPNGVATAAPAVAAERLLGHLTDRLVAASPSEAALAVALRLAPPERVATIANGIDPEPPAAGAPDLRGLLGLGPATPLVGTVARLVGQKAPEEFVAVCAAVARRHAGVHFLLVGMGPLQGRLDAAVATAGVASRFHQIPHLPDAGAALGQLQVFVLASRFEGGPYAPLEAMRAGVPVVLSDVVGNRDTVEAEVSGFLRPFGDAASMAADVVRLLDDDALRRRVTAAAARRVRRCFDVRAMGAALDGLYQELSALPPGRARRRTRRLPQPAPASSSKPPPERASQ